MTSPELDERPQYQAEVEEPPAPRAGPAALALLAGLSGPACAFFPGLRTIGLGLCVGSLYLAYLAIRRPDPEPTGRSGAARAGAVLLVLAAVGLVVSQSAFSSPPSSGLKKGATIVPSPLPVATAGPGAGTSPGVGDKNIAVAFGAPHVELEDSGLQRLTVPITVTNRTRGAASFDLDLEARAASGELITIDTADVANLAAGQSAQLRVFPIVNEKLIAQLLEAQFRVAQVAAY